jgi:HflK protein
MFEFAIALVTETARVLYEGSLFILIGFAIAGLLQEFLPGATIARHLGSESPRSVLYGSLLGVAMPLCSCGVVPAAASLRRKGASRSGITSFLISTPETGEEAIALTWGLLGPLMAIVRPIVALVTAAVAGLLVLFVRDEAPAAAVPAVAHEHDHTHGLDGDDDAVRAARPLGERARSAVRYGFVTLVDELAFWLVLGITLTGVLMALLPNDFFGRVLGWDRGILPMLAMMAVGVPLYLCASASTPVAAGLIAKGLSPGAALVFLLTGPATNVATMALVGQMLGRRVLRVYLASIAGVALAAGLLLDAFAADRVRAAVVQGAASPDGGLLALLKIAAAFVFLALAAASFRRTRFREGRRDVADQSRRIAEALRGLALRDLARPPVAATLAALALLFLASRAVLIVGPGERGVVQRFGRVVADGLEPGLHLHLPAPLGRGFTVDTGGVRQLAIGFQGSPARERASVGEEAFFLTADENLIDLRSVVHWRVSEPARFALGLADAESLLRGMARKVLVAIATGRSIDSLYADGRLAVENAYREALRREVAAQGLGFEVLDVRLLDVHAPASVHDAFRDVASALEDRETEIHDAGGYAAERRAEAEGEAAAITESARADANRVARVAEGTAAPFTALAAVHDEAPALTERRLWLETLERALPAPRKLVLAPGAAGGDVDLWLGSGALPSPLLLPDTAPRAAPERKDGRNP